MKRWVLVLVVALGACRCAPRPPPLSSDAAAIFSRADEPGPGASLVVDVEQARLLGLVEPGGHRAQALTDLALYLLPGVAAQLPNQPAGRLAARVAVLLGLVRDWATWPRLQRFGVLVPLAAPGAADELLSQVTLVVAVRQGKAANEELLAGLAALDRAGSAPLLRTADGDLCYDATGLVGGPVCLRAGDGYFAASSPSGLGTLMPGKGAVRPRPSPPALLKLRADVPLMGRGELSLSGTAALKLAARIESTDSKIAAMLEKTANDYLAALDKNRQATRTLMAPELERAKGALAKDPAAPADLKAVASAMTLDRLLDPTGAYHALRASLHVARSQKVVTVDAIFPEPLVKEVARDAWLFASVAALAATASVAVPSLTRYGCRSRQAEVKATFAGVEAAQRAFAATHGQSASTFGELGFVPPASAAYAYCLAGGCVACGAPGCPPVDLADNACTTRVKSMTPDDAARFVCAIGDPAQSGDPGGYDVWFTFAGEEPMNVQDGCR